MVRSQRKKALLMVGLDNICRSPIAEAVMRNVIKNAGLQNSWHVDSAGIESWHLGSWPDLRASSVLSQHNIKHKKHARLLCIKDFQKFDYIFAMDESNLASLQHLAPQNCKAKLLLLSDFGPKPEERNIEDPFYCEDETLFHTIFQQCATACANFVKQERFIQIVK